MLVNIWWFEDFTVFEQVLKQIKIGLYAEEWAYWQEVDSNAWLCGPLLRNGEAQQEFRTQISALPAAHVHFLHTKVIFNPPIEKKYPFWDSE